MIYGFAVRITYPVCPLVLATVHQLACCIIFELHYNLVNTMYVTMRYTAFTEECGLQRETPNSDFTAPVACLMASLPEEPSGPENVDFLL